MPKSLLIIWSDLHTTDIPIIDEQHRCIVTIINSLYYFMRNHLAEKTIIPLLSLLETYTYLHFLTEEDLLELAGYPDIKGHKKLHESLRAQLQVLLAKTRKTLDPEETLFFLKNFWTKHINEVDSAYAPSVRAGLLEMGKL